MERQERVLVVTADPKIREFSQHLLKSHSRQILDASTAEECLALARNERPGIILVDSVLPDCMGAELCRRIKEDPTLAAGTTVGLLFGPESTYPLKPSAYLSGVMQEGDLTVSSADTAVVDRLFSLSLGMFCVAGLDGYFKELQPSWEHVTGFSLQELTAQPFINFVHPEDKQATVEQVRNLNAGTAVVSFENRYRCKDGSYKWLLWNALPSTERGLIYAVARDVTDQKQSEDRLLTLSRVTEQSPVSVMITDTRGIIEYVNPRFTEVSGFSADELVGQNPRIMKSGKQPAELYEELWRTITAGRVWSGALQNRKKNGEIFWEHETIAPVRDGHGRITHFVSIKEDITERRTAEEKIRNLSALLDVATDAILIRDLENRVLYWNRGAEKTYGWTSEEAVGKNVLGLIYPDPKQYSPAMQALVHDGQWYGEINQKTKEGKQIIAECRWTIAGGNNGHEATVLAINTNITEKKKLEAQFLRAQRMESIGTLAGGIAHDLNNILGPILLSIDYLREKSSDPQSQRVLSSLETSATRGADLVRQVLMFARGVEGEHIVLQPAHLIKDVVKILVETFPRSVKITSDLPKDLWTVSGDPTQLHQVLMNLCVNARDAMPDGGQIHISADNVTLDEHYVRSNLEAQEGPHVVISVVDTGTGIQESVMPRIFEPFFTTKEVGKGTGIGLSTVRAIVRSHGGFINVYSEVGRGSTFKVYMPASLQRREKAARAVTTEVPLGKGELVLVVDDEISILEVTKTSLEAFGYRVLTAQDGTEALAVYSQHKDDIKVVLTDMMMPYLDGAATIRALHKINPRVRVIAASGLEVNGKITNISSQVDAFLPKPYTGEKLLNTLSQVLSKKG